MRRLHGSAACERAAGTAQRRHRCTHAALPCAASRHAEGSSGGDLLELYCGNGNFTVDLAPHFRKVPFPSECSIQRSRRLPAAAERPACAARPPSTPAPHPLQVVATEVSKSSVAAAKRNFELNGVSNVFVARMSSEEFTAAWKDGRAMKR